MLVIATLAACAAATPYTPEAGTAEIPSQDVVRLPDGSVDRAVEQLPDLVERVLEKSGVPGAAVAVVEGEEVLFSEGFGEKVIGEGDAVDEETVFQLASLSKPIGATVVATQVTQDVVEWDTPVAELLDGFALADPWVTDHVTVGDLYAHRSGLPHAAGDDLEDIGYDRDYIIDHLRLEPLDPFRSTYNYANFGMTTGAEAVATAAGVDWATLSEQELYEPLGMTSTSSRYADFLEHDNRTALHALVDGEFQALYERMPDEQAPAGGVSSNVVDLAKWLSLVIGEGTAFQPMCGITGASRRTTEPGHCAQPCVSTPNSTPRANRICMPTQMPSTGLPAASRSATIFSPPTARKPVMHASYAPTPGTTRPSAAAAAAGSEVTSTAAPTRSSARCADRRLPDP